MKQPLARGCVNNRYRYLMRFQSRITTPGVEIPAFLRDRKDVIALSASPEILEPCRR